MALPETRYAKSSDIRIAYQVIGNGPLDLVFVPGFISNLDAQWEDPGFSQTSYRNPRRSRTHELLCVLSCRLSTAIIHRASRVK